MIKVQLSDADRKEVVKYRLEKPIVPIKKLSVL